MVFRVLWSRAFEIGVSVIIAGLAVYILKVRDPFIAVGVTAILTQVLRDILPIYKGKN